MSTLSGCMQTTMGAMQAHQAAINVTANNIANVNTDGYSRQQVVVVEQNTYGQLGNGVEIAGVQRVHDAFVIEQIRIENQDLGKYNAETKFLNSVEAVFTDTEDYGLNKAMADFENSWQEVNNNPSGATERTVLVSDAETLADTFNAMSADLVRLQQECDDAVCDTVDEINRLTQEIAELNEQVARAEAAGQDASTYRDHRDALTADLSLLIDVDTYENGKGQICIRLSDGKPLVEGTTTWTLAAEPNTTTGLKDGVWLDHSGGTHVVTGEISSGELGGLLEVRDELIPDYQKQLDELATSIIEEVNALHTAGYDAAGAAGEVLFTGSGAADMAVNPAIASDPDKIAAASDPAAVPGDGSNALAIADLFSTPVMNGGTASFNEYYHTAVSGIGTDVRMAESASAYQMEMVLYYESCRESVSGVSLDEESAYLIVYQDAYEAAAKVMRVLDELIEVVLNM